MTTFKVIATMVTVSGREATGCVQFRRLSEFAAGRLKIRIPAVTRRFLDKDRLSRYYMGLI